MTKITLEHKNGIEGRLEVGESLRSMTRSRIMSRIKSKETKPEIALRKALWKTGLRGYRKNCRKVLGTPDVCWPGKKVAIFLDSCFWHGCPTHYREPKTNVEYWRPQIARNRKRDREMFLKLKAEGWLVLRLWEHLGTEKMVRSVRLALTRRGGKPSATP